MMLIMWSYFFNNFKTCLTYTFGLIGTTKKLDENFAYNFFIWILKTIGPNILVFAVCIASVSILAVMLQTNWNIKKKKIHFRWNLVQPIAGLKRINSIQSVFTTLKAIAKLIIILPIGYFALTGFAPDMIKLMHTSIDAVLFFTGSAMHTIFWRIIYILIALAVVDFFWTKHQWLKQNKMTKNEVKDEKKSVEGDEVTKRKIINKGLTRIMQRILSSVPKAHVVITNPTHYAVALRYERNEMTAPVVVAKGKGFIALKIREIARQNSVPVIERKTLARALYSSTEVGAEIPNELFKAVAEVLAYIYRMRNRRVANINT